MGRKKQRRCRICKKRPVWTGGDVKNPGPFCKKCYHKRVWPEGQARAKAPKRAEPGIETEFPFAEEMERETWFGGDWELVYDELGFRHETERFWNVLEDKMLFIPSKD